MNSKIFIVIPAFREANTIGKVVKDAKKFVKNIIVVDDGSKDNTAKDAKKAGAVVLKHIVNLGKGSALKTGCDYAVKHGATAMIVLDADGQHDPAEIPDFIKALKGVDIVFGHRIVRKEMPFVSKFGNWLLTRTTALLFKIRLKDTQCGYRAFTADAYKKIRWQSRDYAVETEMIANAGAKGLKYREIPIKTIYSMAYKGTTPIDGIKITARMLWWRLIK